MRRALTTVVVLLLATTGFYVAWPAWTAHRIRHAIETNDPSALAARIDFESVRSRAKPVVTEQVRRSLEQFKQQAGPLGSVLSDDLKKSLGITLAAAAVDASLTPENVIRFARQGKDISGIIKDIAREGAAKPSPAPAGGDQPASPASEPPRKLTLDNIKSYRITGPLSIRVGVAHDANASIPDAIVDLEFTGGTWKVVGILPQL